MRKIAKLENWHSHLTTTMLKREKEKRRVELYETDCVRLHKTISSESVENQRKKMENSPIRDYYNLQHERISKICCALLELLLAAVTFIVCWERDVNKSKSRAYSELLK